jgi:hypothetical protein
VLATSVTRVAWCPLSTPAASSAAPNHEGRGKRRPPRLPVSSSRLLRGCAHVPALDSAARGAEAGRARQRKRPHGLRSAAAARPRPTSDCGSHEGRKHGPAVITRRTPD